MSVPYPRQVARIYQGARGRITALVDELDDAVRYSSDRLLANLRSPVPLRVKVEDAEYRSGPEEGAELLLHTQRDSNRCAGDRVAAVGRNSRR